MHESKKEADAHDRMLELAEAFSSFLSSHIEGISESEAEDTGLLLSRHKSVLIAACKGNPDLLSSLGDAEQAEQSNITPLAAKG